MWKFIFKRSGWLLIPFCLIVLLLSNYFPAVFAQDIIIEPPPFPTPRPGQPVSPPVSPLTMTSHQVNAVIDGPIAHVQLTQVFRNESSRTVEGSYLFPLPADAAVSDFQMTVDGKTLEGKLHPKEEARQIYEAIVRRQRDPALLEYLGRGLFQTSIFPIPAGASRTISLRYAQVLAQKDGLYQFQYPLRSQSLNATSAATLAINIELRNQPGLRTIYSPSHNIQVERTDDSSAKIGYEASNAPPASDFQLYFGASQNPIGLNLLSYKATGEDGFFVLLAAPKLDIDEAKVVQRDIVLVLDVSGSMQGEKIEQARKAAAFVVDHLNPGDRFNLISFSTGVHLWQSTLQVADGTTAKAAHAWIDRLTATGSTDINRALLEALGQLSAPSQTDATRPAYVLFMTDGLPTQGETEPQRILNNAENNKPQRSLHLFTFGVGFDVNTDLLDNLSQALNGRSSYVKPEEQIDEKVSQFYSQISVPVLANVTLDFGKQTVIDEVYPYPLPDLFAGEQLVVVGRYRAGATVPVTLRGVVNGQKIVYQYPNQPLVNIGGDPLVARLWATRKIGALLAQVRRGAPNQELINELTQLSLQYGIVTPYTSYLVEEPAQPLSPDTAQGQTVPQPNAVGAYAAATVESKVERAAAAPASGANAVADSEARAALTTATQATENQAVRYINGKTFKRQGFIMTKDQRQVEFWVDTRYTEQMQVEQVVFGSDRYFALANQPQLAPWLALSTELVIVTAPDKAIRVTTLEP